jgi:levansucrase
MRSTSVRIALALTAAALLSVSCADDDEVGSEPTVPATTAPTTTTEDAGDEDAATADGTSGPRWTVEQVSGIVLDETNTAPVIDRALADERVFDEYWLWDWWPLRDRDGQVAVVDGWSIAIGLTAPSDVLPGQRHDIAELRYFLSDDDGVSWQPGDRLFPEGEALGSRQWAGSAMYDDATGVVYAFYTAAGEDDEQIEVEPADTTDTDGSAGADAEDGSAPAGGDYADGDDVSYQQRMAVATGRLTVDESGVRFSDWDRHTVILEGDDELYRGTADTEGGAGNIDAFRDPWFFRDPGTGDEYLLFTATLPEGRSECPAADGVVGIARAASADLTTWEMLPPILTADCVNKELERPHVLVIDGRYLLLFTTHAHTFAEGVEGPEGLYGFVADDLFGEYEPLNGTALVLANPESDPYQAYSWMTLPDGVVTSFFQYFDLDEDMELSYVGDESAQFQLDHFAGTVAPSIVVGFEGTTTRVGAELAPGQLRVLPAE